MDFSGGLAVKNLPAKALDMGSSLSVRGPRLHRLQGTY